MEEKVVHMVLKVDLQCNCCCKKVRKILCKFPQIRDQIYDEKHGTVMIKVISSTPDKIMKKISNKGDRSIKSIQIKEPEEKKEEKKEKKIKEEEKKKEEPKVVAQPDHGMPPIRYYDTGIQPIYGNPLQPPSQWISRSSLYEGRPSYQYHDSGILATPPSYLHRPIYDPYGGGDDGREYDLVQPSNYYNQENSTWCSIL